MEELRRVYVVKCPSCGRPQIYAPKRVAARKRKDCVFCHRRFDVARATIIKTFDAATQKDAAIQARDFLLAYVAQQHRNDHSTKGMTKKYIPTILEQFRNAVLPTYSKLNSGRPRIQTQNGQTVSPTDQMTIGLRFEEYDIAIDWRHLQGVGSPDLHAKLTKFFGGNPLEPFERRYDWGSIVVSTSGVIDVYFESDDLFHRAFAVTAMNELSELNGSRIVWRNPINGNEFTFRAKYGSELAEQVRSLFGDNSTGMFLLENTWSIKSYLSDKDQELRIESRDPGVLRKYVTDLLRKRVGSVIPVEERVVIVETEDRVARKKIESLESEILQKLSVINDAVSQSTELVMATLNDVARATQEQKDNVDFVAYQVEQLTTQNKQISTILERLVERTELQVRLTREQLKLLERLDLNTLEILDSVKLRVMHAILLISEYLERVYGEIRGWRDLSLEVREKVVELAEKHDVSVRLLARLLRVSHTSILKFRRKMEMKLHRIENHVARATDHFLENGHSFAFSFGNHLETRNGNQNFVAVSRRWSDRQRVIYNYLVGNPGSRIRDIALATGFSQKQVWNTLNTTSVRLFVYKRGRKYYPISR